MTVHVVAAGSSGLVAALRRACEDPGRVVHWEGNPLSSRIDAGDAVVVDLADLPQGFRREEFHKLLPRGDLFAVVTPGMKVHCDWLSVAEHSAVRVAECDDAARGDGYAPVVCALAGHLGGPSPAELAECVLAQEPKLRGLGDFVSAVCRATGKIRGPSDLALAAGVSERAVVRLCAAAEYRRVEHFLCAVRVALHCCLVMQHRVSAGSAWKRVGISDRSNFNRQVARAREGSPKAFDWSRIPPLALAWGLSVALLTGCSDHHAEAAAAAPSDSSATDVRSDSTVALPVVGALVRRGDLVLSVRATGAVRAERQVTLRVETQGTVAEVLVRPGERVTAGADHATRFVPPGAVSYPCAVLREWQVGTVGPAHTRAANPVVLESERRVLLAPVLAIDRVRRVLGGPPRDPPGAQTRAPTLNCAKWAETSTRK